MVGHTEGICVRVQVPGGGICVRAHVPGGEGAWAPTWHGKRAKGEEKGKNQNPPVASWAVRRMVRGENPEGKKRREARRGG